MGSSSITSITSTPHSHHELFWFQDGVHFDLTFHPFVALAQKCLTHTTSQALVNGWMPKKDVISGDLKFVLGVPNHISVGMMEEFVAGLNVATESTGVLISDIDVTAARTALGIAGSFQYSTEGSPLLEQLKKKPKSGDAVCVTGDLGAAFAGLRILLREKRVWMQQQELHQDPTIAFEPELEAYAEAVKQQLAPQSRKDFFDAMSTSKIWPTSVTLLMNGLYNDLQQLLNQASVGAEIYESALPISLTTRDIANELEEDVDRYAFLGGEDYQILFTLPSEQVDSFQEHFKDFVVIGEVKPQKEQLVIHTTERGAEKHNLNGKSR
jgi:thiamine-monophosphate kinase